MRSERTLVPCQRRWVCPHRSVVTEDAHVVGKLGVGYMAILCASFASSESINLLPNKTILKINWKHLGEEEVNAN